MKFSGMYEEDMSNWHQQFERMETDAHQEFLVFLGIVSNEINRLANLAE
ncbi:hypothetical protein [Vibrio sp. 99-70-13A1]|nr:hypothetical protein [Vibrio sp. 99-70-13A1]